MTPFVSVSTIVNIVKLPEKSKDKTILFVGSGNNDFKMVTKTMERNNKIIIKRNIFWYDSVNMVHRKKRELQVYECGNMVNEQKPKGV
jgi:hypothetical protein